MKQMFTNPLPQTTIIDGKRAKSSIRQYQERFQGIPVICLSGTEDYWTQSTNPRLNMIFNEVAIHYDLVIFCHVPLLPVCA